MSIVSPDGSRVVLDGPATLPVLVPHLLGFHPTASLVVIGLDASRSSVRITCRVDLPKDSDSEPDWSPLIHALTRSTCVGALVIVYPAADQALHPLPAAGVVHSVVADLSSAGFIVRDALAISGLKYRSYWCADQGCCPEEGNEPSSEHVLELSAALVLEGSAPHSCRDELISALEPRAFEDEFCRELERKRSAIELRLPVLASERAALLAELLNADEPIGTSTLHRLIVLTATVCADVRSRDLFLFYLTRDPDTHSLIRTRTVLTEVVRSHRDHQRAAAAACLAVISWVLGDGASARVAVEAAIKSDASCRLAVLVGMALDNAEPPRMWTSLMNSMSLSQLVDSVDTPTEF